MRPPPAGAGSNAAVAVEARPLAPALIAPPRTLTVAPSTSEAGSAGAVSPTRTTRFDAFAPAAVFGSSGQITEIIPPWSHGARGAPTAGRPLLGSEAWASAGPCVNVFVRSAKVDGRDVVSVDLHGDGLIKGAVPPQLAGELLARAGPESAGGARAACVPPVLAQSLFDPVINLAAFDSAARLARVGDRWVLASSKAPERAVTQERVQLAAAATRKTRGAAKLPAAKKAGAPVVPAVRTVQAKPVPKSKTDQPAAKAAVTSLAQAAPSGFP